MIRREEINGEIWEVWEPDIPVWTKDPDVWRYLERHYGLKFGGLLDDGGSTGNMPPMITFVKVPTERVKGGR